MHTPATHEHRAVVLVADRISDEGLAHLHANDAFDVRIRTGLDEAALLRELAEADALIVRNAVAVTRKMIEGAPRLRVIGRAGIEIDDIDVSAATDRGIVVMNCPEANADTTAEHTLALLFALARHIPQADRAMRAGDAERMKFVGTEIQGKVLGLLGAGNIGQRVARRARDLGMEPIVYDPGLAPDALREQGATVLPLEVVLAKADFLSIHMPLTDATRHFVNEATIARMQDGVKIIQCSTGGIVDESALAAALESGKVGGLAIDVFEREPPPPDHPLFRSPNVIATPHLGASTHEARARAAVDICRQVASFLVNGELRNAVNLPRLSPAAFRAVAPWLDLARRLGRLLAGIHGGPLDRVEIAFHGGLAKLDTATIVRSAMAGFTSARIGQPVNEVNVPRIANEIGIPYCERRSEHMRDFPSLLALHAHAGATRSSVAGALFGHRQARIVRIDEHPIEALAEGNLLIVRNQDRPGVVGRLGTILGEAGVNIRAMHLSPPRAADAIALATLNVEPNVPAAAMDRIRELSDVESAHVIDLGSSP
jgi:D-3-phosphoglycerate dehydrogenase